MARAAEAEDWIERWLVETGMTVDAIAHRVVHGGPDFTRHVVVTDDMLPKLRRVASLAPEHIPAELDLLEALRKKFPGSMHVACFDTAFHTTLPEVARTLPLPGAIRERGVRRYGFHGLSYEYLVSWMGKRGLREGRSILAHLGNGASMAAVLDGRSVDTTMGFTPAGGLVMGTRTGDLDPGIFRFLAQECRMNAREIDRLVNHESGLKGLGGSADVRDLQADPAGGLALEIFCRAAKKHLCALAGVLGGVDRVIFTGGIGEHAPAIRAGILDGLDFLGLRLDTAANRAGHELIAAPGSAATIHVVAANEEAAMCGIARHLLSSPITTIP